MLSSKIKGSWKALALSGVICVTSMAPRVDAGAGAGGADPMHQIFEGQPTEEQCRLCHGDNLIQPHPLLQELNHARHHARLGEPIIGLALGAFETVAPGNISTGYYSCMACHAVVNPDTYDYQWSFTRDCLSCHPAASVIGKPGEGTNVHHYTESYYARDCSVCHGFLSTDGGDVTNGSGAGMNR